MAIVNVMMQVRQ